MSHRENLRALVVANDNLPKLPTAEGLNEREYYRRLEYYMKVQKDSEKAAAKSRHTIALVEKIVEAVPSPERLDLLIQWLDTYDLITGKNGKEVQTDLRKLRNMMVQFTEEDGGV